MNTFALLRNALRAAFLFLAFLILANECPVNAQNTQPVFPVAQSVAVPGGPAPITTGDFNNDGKLDLAVYYSSSPLSVGIILNFGTSTATTLTTPLCVAGGSQPSFADVNNDKKLDLIYSCNGFLAIQLGNGDGTFQPVSYFGNYSPAAFVITDLNGDGYLDIAALSLNAPRQISVFLNRGATAPGTFASPTLTTAPDGAFGLSAGDFNGDGKRDLLTSAPSDSGVSNGLTGLAIFYGTGGGSLSAPKIQATASYYGYTTGDLNGDGITDVALLLAPIANNVFTSVQILLGSNSGLSPGVSLPVPATPSFDGFSELLSAISLTSDGNVDLVVYDNATYVFHGDGKGDFTLAGTYAVTPSASGYVFGDVNGDGNQDLITPSQTSGFWILPGSGGGTFQAQPGTAVSGPLADVNNDGVADMIFYPALGGSYFATALGRGDGSFAVLNQTTPVPAASTGYVLIPGDFNNDGKIDVIAMQPGSAGHNATPCGPINGQLLSYLGSGDGRFQAKGSAFNLGVNSAYSAVTGDFNNDSNLDLLIYYTCPQAGFLLVPGKGDGTFGNPISPNPPRAGNATPLVGDFNNDGKLDYISGTLVSLGNGDGTFRQLPLTLPAGMGVFNTADLNGDGILDAISGVSAGGPGTGSALYAGVGDGTFQPTPFFTVPLAAYQYEYSITAGDVNGDGHADLLVGESGNDGSSLAVFLADGHGNFTADTNTYSLAVGSVASQVQAVRLNNQAPALPKDNRLDVLVGLPQYNGGISLASLLNQNNPAPAKPSPITSAVSLESSLTTAAPGTTITLTAAASGINPTGSISFAANGSNLGTEPLVSGVATFTTSFASAGSYSLTATYGGDSNNLAGTSPAVAVTVTPATSATTLAATPTAGNLNAQITLTATISGDSPTGSVSFVTGTTTLGTATVTDGAATLQTTFAAAGSYAISAAYQGDRNNAASTSSPVTVVIAAPGFTISASPTGATIPSGQSATFALMVTPVAGFAGTLNFSCSGLPAQAACSFSPSATPAGGSPASTTLTITTQTAVAALSPTRPVPSSLSPAFPSWIPAGGLALAGALGVLLSPRRMKRFHLHLRVLCRAVFVAAIALAVQACGGGGSSSPPGPARTPAGSYTISVNATASKGDIQHVVSISLVVQ